MILIKTLAKFVLIDRLCIGYGYEAKFAPELAKDKIISYCMENESADLVSVLTGQSSLLYISQDVRTELKEYAEQQTQKVRKQK